MRTTSVKIVLTEQEKAQLERRAAKSGFTGRGAVVRYIRWREKLPEIALGAPVGNQNKRKQSLSLDDRMEIARYIAFRKVRNVRDTVCRNGAGKRFLTRVMRRLK